jgi:transketolase
MTSTSMLRTQERPASQSERPDDDVCINTIRTLAMDAVQKANSGHPGTLMGLAPVVYTLWQEFLRYDPDDPLWPDRDRFVLSAGHASMLLYALLHLARVRRLHGDGITSEPAVSLDDIKRFRRIDSVTPGHPEYGLTTGVETTTGPLGQGCGNSVGMAIAARWLAAHYNRPGFTLFNHDVYVICSDGDLMEGVASEAASLAGHLGLANLSREPLPIFDRNRYASASGLARGAYVMADAENGEPRVILIGTGSEVQLCIAAYEELRREGIAARVVSMPSWELFEQQDGGYREAVLPAHITARVTVEQGSVIGWDRYAGQSGAIVGMHRFGGSAPLKDLLAKFGFSPQKVLEAAKAQIAEAQPDKGHTAK